MQEKQKKMILRISMYLIGIVILACGITMNTKTKLGVSPIISMPYAVAQIWGFETGKAVFAAVFDLYFAADHPVKREVSAVSAFTDSGKLPDQRLYLDQLGMRLALLVLAIILTGIGAAITVDVNIVPNPADGLARVLGEKCGKNMGFGKNLFDFSAIVISIVIGMIGAGHIVGIGIGTVVAMICTGRVIAVFNHFLKKKIEMSVM